MLQQANVLITHRGHKDAADIIEAALNQGWELRRNGKSGGHLQLVPPNGGVPVGIAGSPSNVFRRKIIITQMRKSGFLWPPPESKKIARIQARKATQGHLTVVAKEEEPVAAPTESPEVLHEQWVQPVRFSDYEVSNAGRTRWFYGQQIIEPRPDGQVELCDDNGKNKIMNPKVLCRAAFGHGPKRWLAGFSAERPVSPEMSEEQPPPQKETPVNVVELPLDPDVDDEELDSGEQDEAQRSFEQSSSVEWQPVLIEGVKEGYEVNSFAGIRSPKGRIIKPLDQVGSNGKIYVQLQLANPKLGESRQKKFPLADIVLEAFTIKPGPQFIPRHFDGNLANCTLPNLSWGESPVAIVPPPTPRTSEPFPMELTGEEVHHEDPIPVRVHDHSVGTHEQEKPVTIAEPPAVAEEVAVANAGFSTLVENLLKREGFTTLGDIAKVSALELLCKRSWTIDEVREVAATLHGYHLELMRGPSVIQETPNLLPMVVDDDISEHHVYTHPGSGLAVHVDSDGKISAPDLTTENAAIVSRLLARAAR